MRRTVSGSIGCVDTGDTTPLTLRLIGAPQEMNRSEACFSAISLNSRSRNMSKGLGSSNAGATIGGKAPERLSHDDVMKRRRSPERRERSRLSGGEGARPIHPTIKQVPCSCLLYTSPSPRDRQKS